MRTHILAAALIATSLVAAATPVAAAERHFSANSFTRIRIDGPYKVRLAVGVAPFATATGSPQALDGLAIDVQGATLVVHADRSSWGGSSGQTVGPVEISLGTHELTAAWVNGSGSLAIDQVKGLGFDLSVQGSGGASIDKVAVDQFKLGLAGAASARLAGAALRMTAIVRGSSVFDGSALATKNVTIGAEGPAIVKLIATETAKVDAMGASTVTLSGSPACTVRAQGSASVEGCH